MRSEKAITLVGLAFLVLSALLMALLLLRPFSDDALALMNWAATIVAFVAALLFCSWNIRLYGSKSAEGKFWTAVLLMLLIIFLGIVVAEFMPEGIGFHVYSGFNAVAFTVFTWGTWKKLRSAGARPKPADYGFAGLVVFVMLMATSMFMMTLSGQSGGAFRYSDYPVEFITVFISYAVIVICSMMARLMGGHISKGWYIMAFAAAVNALAFTFSAGLQVVGAYTPGHYVDGMSIIALNAVSFSAYYQYKKHMALLEDMG